MNNIDILERVCECRRFSGVFTDVECIFKAIETLIAENKELKEELDSVKEIYYTQREIEDNYIPKSKVEEIIKEYKKKGNSVGIPDLYRAEIELLQSLLGKE